MGKKIENRYVYQVAKRSTDGETYADENFTVTVYGFDERNAKMKAEELCEDGRRSYYGSVGRYKYTYKLKSIEALV